MEDSQSLSPPKVGDIVLFHHADAPPLGWASVCVEEREDHFLVFVLRPYGEYWARAVEGIEVGQFSQRGE